MARSVDELVIIPGRSVGESRYRNDFSSIVKFVDSRIDGTGIIIIPDWLDPRIWFAIPINVGGAKRRSAFFLLFPSKKRMVPS